MLSLTHETFAWVPILLCLAANHSGYTMHLGGDLLWHESDTVARGVGRDGEAARRDQDRVARDEGHFEANPYTPNPELQNRSPKSSVLKLETQTLDPLG